VRPANDPEPVSATGESAVDQPLIHAGDSSSGMRLTATAERLELRFMQRAGPGPIYVDFVGGPHGYARRVKRFGLIFQAIGFRRGRPTVLDATAGLGGDAFRLAYHGCRVTAVERSPTLFALLQDGLTRAERVPEIREHLGNRLLLVHADARDLLQRLSPPDVPDVVYLDPMFPIRKTSALAKIEMRALRQIVGDDSDARELFELARAVARQRVVVKRHRRAEPLAPRPAHTFSDKTTRFDVYVRAS
jgi:16S rRNA (guanine1516-N2)-methyltransferase